MSRNSVIPGISQSIVPSRAKEILSRCKTTNEVELECAIWTVEILKEYKFKSLPLAPSVISNTEDDEAAAFRRSTDTTRVSPEIMRYYELNRKIQVENSSTFDWLTKCREVLLKAGKMIEAQQIKVKLEEVKEEQLYRPKGGEDGASDY